MVKFAFITVLTATVLAGGATTVEEITVGIPQITASAGIGTNLAV
jgi:hypothetical protein